MHDLGCVCRCVTPHDARLRHGKVLYSRRSFCQSTSQTRIATTNGIALPAGVSVNAHSRFREAAPHHSAVVFRTVTPFPLVCASHLPPRLKQNWNRDDIALKQEPSIR